MATTTILDCGHEPSVHLEFTTGYGTYNGETQCYECCARIDREAMVETGKATLYDTENEITNWPGSLRFRITWRQTGKHNIAGKRYDAWFDGPDGYQWHCVRYGDMTQLAHCKRTKTLAVAS